MAFVYVRIWALSFGVSLTSAARTVPPSPLNRPLSPVKQVGRLNSIKKGLHLPAFTFKEYLGLLRFGSNVPGDINASGLFLPEIAFGKTGNLTNATLHINPNDILVESFDGWGTSLAWWANSFGSNSDLADALFTLDEAVTVRDSNSTPVPGLGLNFVRYNVGATGTKTTLTTDGRPMYVSQNKGWTPSKQIATYWLDDRSWDTNSSSWDWNVDRNQRQMLLFAKARGADRFELFANSPPWWMTRSLSPNGASGFNFFNNPTLPNPVSTGATKNNLPKNRVGHFAYYLAAVAAHAKKHWDINFNTVEPFNEPVNPAWSADGRQEGSWFSRKMQQRVIEKLRVELDRNGLDDVNISAADDNLVSQAYETWKRYSSHVRSIVGQVNTHAYETVYGPRKKLWNLVSRIHGKKIYQSEAGVMSNLGMTMTIMKDLKILRCHAWAYWQPVDPAEDWAMMTMQESHESTDQDKLGEAQTKWYVFAQFTRHIRPGMDIVALQDEDAENIPVVAAWDRIKNKLVIVAVAYWMTFTFNLPLQESFDINPGHETQMWTTFIDSIELGDEYRKHTGPKYEKTTGPSVQDDGSLALTVEKNHVVTLELDGIIAKPSAKKTDLAVDEGS